MRIAESALRREIRRIMLENFVTNQKLQEEDAPSPTIISDPNERYNRVKTVLSKSKGAFRTVVEQISKTAGPMKVRVVASFMIQKDGTVSNAKWIVDSPKEKSEEEPYTALDAATSKTLTDNLTRELSRIKFCKSDEQFSETIRVDEFPLILEAA